MSQGLQPLLHELNVCVAAPTVVLSDRDGQIRPEGAQGVLVADVRVLSRAELTTGAGTLEPIAGACTGADTAEFVAVLRSASDPTPDPVRWLRRRRRARPTGIAEHIVLFNAGGSDVELTLTLALAADFAGIGTIKSGGHRSPVPPLLDGSGVRFQHAGTHVAVTAREATVATTEEGVLLTWTLRAPARGSSGVDWSLEVSDREAAVVPPAGRAPLAALHIRADDRRIPPFVTRSIADLQALRMAPATNPDDEFLAAGAPWYLTLFGRDSIWAARMLLPLGTDLAAGTLRALAARQGRRLDPRTAEAPGKILHELRRPGNGSGFLPPVYYGTVDATPLWVCLLADSWRWGMDAAQIEPLLPAAESALEWIAGPGDPDGDGFLEYVDAGGTGLANQGWKDSSDSIRFADGTVATGPVALSEVQGYAFEAALAGAELLEAFGHDGADRWYTLAEKLAARFRDRFWVTDPLGPYPALALDGDKRPVDAPASNMGHLLGTGILSAEEERIVADRLLHPSMFSGFGLRTMSSATGGYSPLSYHCGSVWPHDTAIAIRGLTGAGLADHATRLAEGLLAAGDAFDGRLPELFAGFSSADVPFPVPYPAACRPQAWATASAVSMLQAFLGLQAEVPKGRLRVNPPATMGWLEVSGLRVAGADLSITVGGDGAVQAHLDGTELVLDVG